MALQIEMPAAGSLRHSTIGSLHTRGSAKCWEDANLDLFRSVLAEKS